MTRITTLWVFLGLIVVLGACGIIVPSIITNIPSDRLSSETYTSPGGEYTVKIPPLLRPGTRIEERQINPLTNGVFFADDLGRAYIILISDNQETGFTLDTIAKDFQVGEFLREKEIIDTGHGPELRLVAINKGGSPLVTRTNVSGAWETKKNDLVEARTIFLHGNYIYDIGAGVTPLHEESESKLMAMAARNLEQFLRGLVTNSR